MTELVLKIENNKDLQLLLKLVKRLGISVQQKKIITEQDQKQLKAIIEKGVVNSSFGDAATYQRAIRKDRKLPFRD